MSLSSTNVNWEVKLRWLSRTSYTTSLTSTVTSYKYENGRRYHAQEDRSKFYYYGLFTHSKAYRLSIEYFLPNDDVCRTCLMKIYTELWADRQQKENDRLDLFHHLLTLRMDDKLHLAPIGSNPQSILDLGTGSGIWAIEMGLHPACYPHWWPLQAYIKLGEAYPSAEVCFDPHRGRITPRKCAPWVICWPLAKDFRKRP